MARFPSNPQPVLRPQDSGHVTLIVTGGLRTPADCVKALALGADGIALANAAIQAIGCVGSRILIERVGPVAGLQMLLLRTTRPVGLAPT